MSKLPNVHASTHPVIASKIAELRSAGSDSRAVRILTDEISTLLAYEATALGFSAERDSSDRGTTPKGHTYDKVELNPQRPCLVPVLRSGLGMQSSFLALLPVGTEVHHLGLFREEATLAAVEYYNRLPSMRADGPVDLAFILDPIVATGNTATAAIQILQEWGISRIVFCCIIASEQGLERIAKVWPEGTQFVVGQIDPGLDDKGYILPGMGDMGDRLYHTK
ncbi:hypothetical protein PYCC9005_001114 [Savitreella phatthalungensis]